LRLLRSPARFDRTQGAGFEPIRDVFAEI